MSFTKLIRNEVFSLSTICFIAIPLIISYSNNKNTSELQKQQTANQTIPSITKIVKSNEITRTISNSINTIKNIQLPTGNRSSSNTYRTKQTSSKSNKLYINR